MSLPSPTLLGVEKITSDYRVDNDLISFFAPLSSAGTATLEEVWPSEIRELMDADSPLGWYERETLLYNIQSGCMELGPNLPRFDTQDFMKRLAQDRCRRTTSGEFSSLLENFHFFPGDGNFRSEVTSLVQQMWSPREEKADVNVSLYRGSFNRNWKPFRDENLVYFVVKISISLPLVMINSANYLFAVEREERKNRAFTYISLGGLSHNKHGIVSVSNEGIVVASLSDHKCLYQRFVVSDGPGGYKILPLDRFERQLDSEKYFLFSHWELSRSGVFLTVRESTDPQLYHLDILALPPPKAGKSPEDLPCPIFPLLCSDKKIVSAIHYQDQVYIDKLDRFWILSEVEGRPRIEILRSDLESLAVIEFGIGQNMLDIPELYQMNFIGHWMVPTPSHSPYDFILCACLGEKKSPDVYYYGLTWGQAVDIIC